MESDTKLKDELTQKIGVLTRRETEARIIAPFVDALIKTFGKEEIIPTKRNFNFICFPF